MDLDALARRLGLSEEETDELLFLTHWVDNAIAIEVYGYPKDNVIPPPLSERLGDQDYRARLIEAARECEVDLGLISKLEHHWAQHQPKAEDEKP